MRRHVDEATVSAAQRGDRAAIAAVCTATLGLVQWWARRYAREPQLREELVSLGHLAIFDALRLYRRGKSAWGPYVSLWLRARMANHKRDTHKLREVDDAALKHMDDGSASPFARMAENDDTQALRAAVASLPMRHQRIMKRRLAGWTLGEVGELLDLSRERVRQEELAAVYRIRTLMGVEGVGPVTIQRRSPTPRHGTRSMYCTGCRCAKCREANTTYQRLYTRRSA